VLTIIIGKRSNLSVQLAKKLENNILVSSDKIKEEFALIDFKKYTKINIIFNQFQKASQLSQIDEPFAYVQRSILTTAIVLEYILAYDLNINKIIYTSSSAVYGNNTHCSEDDTLKPANLHASLKVSNEKLIEHFCTTYKIDYTIARLFNMYGGEDTFSIISKILSSYKNSNTLMLINEGDAIRDFIHIDDVVQGYLKILVSKNIPKINLGTSEGKSVLYILDYLRKHNIIISSKSIKREELKVSISKNDILLSLLGNYKFKKVEQYVETLLKG